MYIPFGVKHIETNYSQWDNCHIDCSLNQSKSEESVKYQEAIDGLDKRIQELVSNSELFDISEENTYFPILKENKTYPKLIKISLPRDSQGNFKPFAFDENKEQIVLTDSNIDETLSKGSVFASIIECARMWQYNGRIGSTWNLVQLKLMPKPVFDDTKQQNSSSYKELMIED